MENPPAGVALVVCAASPVTPSPCTHRMVQKSHAGFLCDLCSSVLLALWPESPPCWDAADRFGPFPFLAKKKKKKRVKLSKLLGNDITLKSDTMF